MFYDNLVKLCDEKGVKITPLVKKLGMSSGNLSRWQNGISPTGETVLKFSDYFGVSTDYLLKGKESNNELGKEKNDMQEKKNRIFKNF